MAPLSPLLALITISAASAAGRLELGLESTDQPTDRRDVGVRVGGGLPLHDWLEAGLIVGWAPGTTFAPWGSYSQLANAWQAAQIHTPSSAVHVHAHSELRFLPFGGSTDRSRFRTGAFIAGGASLVGYDYQVMLPAAGERAWSWRPTASFGLSTEAQGDRQGIRLRVERLDYRARFPNHEGLDEIMADITAQETVYIFSVDWLVSLRRRPKRSDSTRPEEPPPDEP